MNSTKMIQLVFNNTIVCQQRKRRISIAMRRVVQNVAVPCNIQICSVELADPICRAATQGLPLPTPSVRAVNLRHPQVELSICLIVVYDLLRSSGFRTLKDHHPSHPFSLFCGEAFLMILIVFEYLGRIVRTNSFELCSIGSSLPLW